MSDFDDGINAIINGPPPAPTNRPIASLNGFKLRSKTVISSALTPRNATLTPRNGALTPRNDALTLPASASRSAIPSPSCAAFRRSVAGAVCAAGADCRSPRPALRALCATAPLRPGAEGAARRTAHGCGRFGLGPMASRRVRRVTKRPVFTEFSVRFFAKIVTKIDDFLSAGRWPLAARQSALNFAPRTGANGLRPSSEWTSALEPRRVLRVLNGVVTSCGSTQHP